MNEGLVLGLKMIGVFSFSFPVWWGSQMRSEYPWKIGKICTAGSFGFMGQTKDFFARIAIPATGTEGYSLASGKETRI